MSENGGTFIKITKATHYLSIYFIQMYQHFHNNLSVTRNQKSSESLIEGPDENIFHQVLLEMPIPSSFRDSFKELKGIAVSVLAVLNTQFGAPGQHMLLIERAL